MKDIIYDRRIQFRRCRKNVDGELMQWAIYWCGKQVALCPNLTTMQITSRCILAAWGNKD